MFFFEIIEISTDRTRDSANEHRLAARIQVKIAFENGEVYISKSVVTDIE